ncbi:MAG: DUF1822 family protein [Thainema sp.]
MMSTRPITNSSNFEPMADTIISLTDDHITQATRMAANRPDAQQWSTYLNMLVLYGVQQWLQQAEFSQTVCHLSEKYGVQCNISDYRLCVLPMTSLTEERVQLPDLETADIAHLYVLAEVQEEVAQVNILAGLRADKLAQLVAHQSDKTNDSWLPLSAFQESPEQLLLYLRCLDPNALASASAPQVAPIATADFVRSVSRSLLNVSHWFKNELDEVASALQWSLLPPLASDAALLSPTEIIESVLKELSPVGISVPPRARGASTEIQLGGLTLQLYALTWTIFEENQPPEWSLFLVLGPRPGDSLPPGTRLQVADPSSVLSESVLHHHTDSMHLYAQVFGTWDEAFAVTISLPNGPELTLPAFVYQPENNL